MSTTKIICAEAKMLIRKPVAEVFEAFINPEITKYFWFTKGSSKLEVNTTATWEWEMYNIQTKVLTKEIVLNRKIVFDWLSSESVTTVEITFTTVNNYSTYVEVKHYGFNKTGDELIEAIKDSTGGFTTVLDGLKAFMEHNINLNLIADKFPKEVAKHGN